MQMSMKELSGIFGSLLAIMAGGQEARPLIVTTSIYLQSSISLNVVNASAEFLAEIVLSYSSELRLRKMVERLEDFTVNIRKNEYQPSKIERESYEEAEEISVPVQNTGFRSISISAASLERFQSANR